MSVPAVMLCYPGAADGLSAPIFELLPETDLGRVYRGDTIVLPVWEARDQTGALLDLTGATVWFTAKTDLADADTDEPSIQRTTSNGGVVLVNAPNGTYQVMIDPASTQQLPDDTAFTFDVQVRTALPATSTVRRGVLVVVRDVTQATA